MKIVFNSIAHRSATLRLAFLGLLVGLGLVVAPFAAHADSVYFTKRQLLTSFFPKSDKVSFTEFVPTTSERASLKRKLGYELSRKKYYFYVATTAGKIDGYAFIDDVMGQHRPITYGVKLSPSGVVESEEVLVYREAHGSEVRSQRFSKQFQGKTVNDSMRASKDIDSVTGATISSRAITIGVRRALVLFDTAILLPKRNQVSTK